MEVSMYENNEGICVKLHNIWAIQGWFTMTQQVTSWIETPGNREVEIQYSKYWNETYVYDHADELQ